MCILQSLWVNIFINIRRRCRIHLGEQNIDPVARYVLPFQASMPQSSVY